MKFIIRIRFTNSLSAIQQIDDLDLPISILLDSDISNLINTQWIKQQIRNKPQCHNKRLRLIYNGRVLNDNSDFKQEIFLPKIRQAKFQAEVKSPPSENLDQTPEATREPEPSASDASVVYIHCVIGEELSNQQLLEESQLDNLPQPVSTTPNVIGFDRLLQQGFSQEDISDLRRQFHLVYNINPPARNEQIHDLEEEEARLQSVRQLEERWIESTINGNENTQTATAGNIPAAALDNNFGTAPAPQTDIDDVNGNFDLLVGLLVGIFLGVLSIIFLVVDDTVFNKRQKMSILAGLFINFSFAILRGQWV